MAIVKDVTIIDLKLCQISFRSEVNSLNCVSNIREYLNGHENKK